MAGPMTISAGCTGCPMNAHRGAHCESCVVTVLEAMSPPTQRASDDTAPVLARVPGVAEASWPGTPAPAGATGTDPGTLETAGDLPLDPVERRALDIFVSCGLVSVDVAAAACARDTRGMEMGQQRMAGMSQAGARDAAASSGSRVRAAG